MEPVRESFRTHGSASFEDDRRQSRRRTVAEVTTVRVNAQVWSTAMDLAEGDALRIEVINEDDVRVLNRRR